MDKIKLFLIFALLSCTKEEIHAPCRVNISNANPIQFWLTGDESFNQKEVCGINPTCFCQPFQCDDTIKVQLIDTSYYAHYELRAFDTNSNLLWYREISRMLRYTTLSDYLQFSNYNFQSSISPWRQQTIESNDLTWTWISDGSIEADGFTSGNLPNTKFLYQPRTDGSSNDWPIGSYHFSLLWTSNNGLTDLYIQASDDLVNFTTVYSHLNNSTGSFGTSSNFTTSKTWKYFGIRIKQHPSISGIQVFIQQLKFTQTPLLDFDYSLFDLNFIPSNEGLCDKQVQFKIFDTSSSPHTEVAFSDCIDIKTTQDCSNLIEYSNSSDFAGLKFPEESPAIKFYLRVPSVFFDEDFPQEQEDLELSDDTIITLWSKTERKKLFTIGDMPFYMHQKLILIFQMDNLVIDDTRWRKRDQYNFVSPQSKRYALRQANVLLSDQDFIDRNLL